MLQALTQSAIDGVQLLRAWLFTGGVRDAPSQASVLSDMIKNLARGRVDNRLLGEMLPKFPRGGARPRETERG